MYVTRTVNGCQSGVAKTELRQGPVDLKKAVPLPNLITPNGDKHNQFFRQSTLVEGICIGSFLFVRIYNSWGKMVYHSTDPNFAWDAQGQSAGLFYYQFRYSNTFFSGRPFRVEVITDSGSTCWINYDFLVEKSPPGNALLRHLKSEIHKLKLSSCLILIGLTQRDHFALLVVPKLHLKATPHVNGTPRSGAHLLQFRHFFHRFGKPVKGDF
jgi:hypothetical protein